MIAGNGCWCFWLKTWFERIWCKKKEFEAENVYKRKAKQSNTTISNAVLPEVEWIFQSVGCVEPSWPLWTDGYDPIGGQWPVTFTLFPGLVFFLGFLSFLRWKKNTKTDKVLILLHTFTTIVAPAFCIT